MTLEQQQLCKFYQVDNLDDLIKAMCYHIERLQDKIIQGGYYQINYGRVPREG